MKILFSATANEDLAQIVRYISRDKPVAAKKWAAEIRASVEKLSEFPKLGRIVPEYADENIREIIKGRYRIVYKIYPKEKTIVILTIFQGKRML